jgi:YidC/Oxa1 family membrane protein insertase
MRLLLDWLFNATGNYGLAIILMTLLLRVVLFPLTAKGMRANFKMQEIQPEIKELQKKFKKDPDQLNRATTELWKKNGVNPFAGCITMLIQLPVIFGFIGALREYEFVGNPAFLWIPHLGQSDPIYILPVLAAIGTYVQSKITTPTTDKSMQTMTYMFPVMVLAFGFKMPAAFTLYWVFSSVFSVAERYLIVRPTPKEQAGDPA